MTEDMWIEEISLEDIQAEDVPEAVDPKALEGMRARIESVQVRKGDYGPYLYVATEVLGDSGYRATRLFSLKEKEGKIVWSRKGNLQAYLDKVGVAHPKDLKGKSVVVVVDANGYLSFV